MRTLIKFPSLLVLSLAVILTSAPECCCAGVTSPAPAAAAEPAKTPESTEDFQAVALPNSDFESGEANWILKDARGLARVRPEAARNGKAGLRIESPDDDKGARVVSARIPAKASTVYQLTWNSRVLAGSGTTLFLRFFDEKGGEILREQGRVTTDRGNQWTQGSINVISPAQASEMDLLIMRTGMRSPNYLIDLDDFELSSRSLRAAAPWPGTYKIRPEETARLTAADVVGPDGHVYPDWTWAGVPGGIPKLPVVVRLADMGAKPGENIAALLEQAVAKAGEQGGGAVEIGEGTFYLDEPVLVFSDKVSIRGAGRDKTRLLFRYNIPAGELRFFRLKPGDTLGQNSNIEFHVNPRNLIALELKSAGKSLARRVRKDHWGNTFSLRVSAQQATKTLGEGIRTFTAIAEYENGVKVEKEIDLRLDGGSSGQSAPSMLGAINFVGSGTVNAPIKLAADTRRGERVLRLVSGHGLKAGDRITVVAPASERWRKLVGHASQWGDQAQNMHEVVSVDGDTLTLNQPVRTEFLTLDDSYVQKVVLITGCGLEDLYLEQVLVPGQPPPGPKHPQTLWYPIDDLWTSGVIFNQAWGCWLTGVTVRNTGRNAAYFPFTKHMEIRDCLFDEAIFKGGGGTGYVGFERSWDCLMDNVEVRGMRHAPNNQWSAAGNVIRNGRFLGSDGQWHAGWTLENLYENNFIDARGDGGSYGHGLYASGPSVAIHGPQGPRNVAYGNDIVARKDCLHMLGGNEAWMIMYNRFVTDNGRAVFAKEKSFDHIIEGNVFVLKQAQTPAVLLGADSVGVELVNNSFYGVKPPLITFTGAATSLLRDEGNRSEANPPKSEPARPQPAVPSIFQWQLDHIADIRATAQSRATAAKP